MNQEAQEYYNIASWTKDKVNYNRVSKFNDVGVKSFSIVP